jgi:micrococcal nuclease
MQTDYSPRPLRRRGIRFGVRAALLLVVVAFALYSRWREPPALPAPELLTPGRYVVERVVDGDTFVLANGARVRLIGVDTPETVKANHPIEPWGPEASARTKRLVEGREVRLEFDKERQDQYERYLAYAWYGDPQSGEEKLLNEELIRAGLGRAALQYRYSESMKRRFRRAEEDAQDAGVGLWSAKRRAA